MFGRNIKLLRKRQKRSQQEVADLLGLKRSSWSAYENETAEPNFSNLLKISNYFDVSIDVLLQIDLSKMREKELSQLEKGYDLKGQKLRVLSTTIAPDGEENIELVPIKAKAGYTTSFSDHEFINTLHKFQLPFLPKGKTYRSFEIGGDSMPPIKEGSWVTGSYVQNWQDIKDGTPCIVVTVEEGIVFKLVYNQIETKRSLLLSSTNPLYKPFELPIHEVAEIWKLETFNGFEM